MGRTKKELEYYEVVCEGEYRAKISKTLNLNGYEAKPYRIPFKVSKTVSFETLRSYCRDKILPKLLLRLNSNYDSIRICKIVSCTGGDKSASFELLDRERLEDHIALSKIAIDSTKIEELDDLKELLRIHRDEPARFELVHKKILIRQEEQKEIDELNKDICNELEEKKDDQA